MPTARPQTYTAPSGGSIYAGMPAPVAGPAWLAGATVNAWASIPNTSCPSQLIDFSGVAIRDESSLTEVWVGGGGGHASGTNAKLNDTWSINLAANSPTWVKRSGPSDPGSWDGTTTAILPDGTPAPRHLYTDITWCPEVRLYVIGGRFLYEGRDTRATHFGWSPDTNSWTRLADRAADGVNYSVRDPRTGYVYSSQSWYYDPVTNTHNAWSMSGSGVMNRIGSCWDSKRNRITHFSFGDGWTVDGFGPDPQAVVASVISVPGGVRTPVTFNPSAALTAVRAEARTSWLSSAIEYNPDLDVFYVYGGYLSSNVYVLTPNDSGPWDIALLPASGSLPSMNGTALNKLRYISKYKALFVFNGDQNIRFLRTQ